MNVERILYWCGCAVHPLCTGYREELLLRGIYLSEVFEVNTFNEDIVRETLSKLYSRGFVVGNGDEYHLTELGIYALAYVRTTRQRRMLQLLYDEEELYSLDIQRKHYRVFNKGLSESTLYVELRRLERQRLLTARWSEERYEERAGGRRRYYSLTELGRIAVLSVRHQTEQLLKVFEPGEELDGITSISGEYERTWNKKKSFGALYPLLRHMESVGFLSSRWGTPGDILGARPRLYKITQLGKDILISVAKRDELLAAVEER